MLLSIETASYSHATIALLDGSSVLECYSFPERRTVAALLVTEIAELLERNGVSPEQIDAVAVDCGPGSFTGIRIGIATAQGLADGWGIPIYGLSVFELISLPATREQDQLILMDAKAGGGYYYELRRAEGSMARGFITPDEIAEKLPVISPKGGIVQGEIGQEPAEAAGWRYAACDCAFTAADIGRAACGAIKKGTAVKPEPLYLHSQIKRKK